MPDPRLDDSSSNPYAAPRAAVTDVYANTGETQPVHLFSARGRMGRLRYLCWNGAFGAAAFLLSFIVLITTVGTDLFSIRNEANLVQMFSSAGAAIDIIIVIMICWFVVNILMMIRRSHDMGWSGWSVLIAVAAIFAGNILVENVSSGSPFFDEIVGFAFRLVPYIWCIKPGAPGPNRFGPPPSLTPLAVQIFGWIFAAFIAIYSIFVFAWIFIFLA